jgi:protein SCO1
VPDGRSTMGSSPHILDRVNPRIAIALGVAGALALAAVLLAVLGDSRDAAVVEDGGTAAGVTAPASRFAGATVPRGVRAPDFRLRDQDGRPVTMRELRGRPVVVTFLYTHCDESCPAQAQQIKGALDHLGRDLPAIAISVEPERDDERSARGFLAEQGVTGRLRFVLGSRDELEPLWRAYAIRPQSDEAEHQGRIVLVDSRGLQRVGFTAERATPEALANDLRLLGAG